MWLARATLIAPAAVHAPVTGSYNSAPERVPEEVEPPVTSTLSSGTIAMFPFTSPSTAGKSSEKPCFEESPESHPDRSAACTGRLDLPNPFSQR